jgi:serine/threonine protein kinase
MHPGDEPLKLREIWPAGTVIKGDYVIEKRLGGGGFGTVYLARHRFLGTTHVIKRLHEQFASDAEYVRKFINEGRAVRRLKACPNIVEVEHMTQSEADISSS